MKKKIHALLWHMTTLGFLLQAHGQGTFRNLNFEEAFNLPILTPPTSTAFVPATNALPGWSVHLGTNQFSDVLYNGVSGGSALVTLITSNSANAQYGVLAGNYTATLDGGIYGGGFDSAGIAQTGLVPSGSLSLRFIAAGDIGYLSITFDGQNLPFFLLDAASNYQVYGADISAFQSLTGSLQFTEQPAPTTPRFTFLYLDDITFSNQPIPEPSVLALFALGALLLGWRFVRVKYRGKPAKETAA